MPKRVTLSPYTKYGKAPHRYSQQYYAWRSAMLRGDEHSARQLGFEHSRIFGPHRDSNGNLFPWAVAKARSESSRFGGQS